MRKIDAHQHFWKYDPVKDGWITNEMGILRRDFLPADVWPLLQQNGFSGCIAVQADQSENETLFLLHEAENNEFILGVVGWIDLRSKLVKKKLQHLKKASKLKGLRHILQSESQRDYMLREDFKKGISCLKQYDLTYDILIYPDQLAYALTLVKEFPEQKFVIDHLAKPFIKFRKNDDWERNIRRISVYKNVFCKISGFVTEADWNNWTREEFQPYFDIVVSAFGPDRIMFGSDWPVCLVAASFQEVVAIVTDYFSVYSKDENEKIFGKNAIQFYNL